MFINNIDQLYITITIKPKAIILKWLRVKVRHAVMGLTWEWEEDIQAIQAIQATTVITLIPLRNLRGQVHCCVRKIQPKLLNIMRLKHCKRQIRRAVMQQTPLMLLGPLPERRVSPKMLLRHSDDATRAVAKGVNARVAANKIALITSMSL